MKRKPEPPRRCFKCKRELPKGEGTPIREVAEKFGGLRGFNKYLLRFLDLQFLKDMPNVHIAGELCSDCFLRIFTNLSRRVKRG